MVDTGQLGVYSTKWGEEGEAQFAVNLFMPNESDLRPADNLALTGAPTSVPAGSQPERAGRREWWRLLALAALALLVAEWALYHRATVARLWSGLKRQTFGIRRQPET